MSAATNSTELDFDEFIKQNVSPVVTDNKKKFPRVSAEEQDGRDRLALKIKNEELQTNPDDVNLKKDIALTQAQLNSGYKEYSQEPAGPMTPQALVDYISNPKTDKSVKADAVIDAIQSPKQQADTAARVSNLGGNSDQAVAKLMAIIEKQGALTEDQIRVGKNNAELANKILVAQSQNADAVAADVYGAVVRAGTDLTNSESLINQSLVANVKDFKDTQAWEAEIRRKQSIGFLDNPAEWLINQFTLGDDINAHNTLAERINARNKFIDATNQTVQLAKTANAGKLSTMSAAQVAAQSEINVNNAELEAIKARAALLVTQGHDVKDALTIAQGTTQILTAEQLKARQLVGADVQRAYQNSLSEDRLAMKEEEAAAKKRTKEEQEARDEYVKTALSGTGLSYTTEKQIKDLPVHLRERIAPLLNRTSATDPYADNPSDALELQKLTRGNIAGNQSQKNALSLANSVKDKAEGNKLIEAMKPEEKRIEVNKAIKAQFNDLENRPDVTIKIGQQDWNPYTPSPIMKVLPFLPPSNTFVQAANDVGTKLPKGMELTHAAVLQQMVQQVVDGKLNLANAAKDISAYAQYQIDTNNTHAELSKFGLPDQTTLKQDLPFPFSGRTNLANQTEVLKVLLKAYGRTVTNPEGGQ